jgi:hypothetical protein
MPNPTTPTFSQKLTSASPIQTLKCKSRYAHWYSGTRLFFFHLTTGTKTTYMCLFVQKKLFISCKFLFSGKQHRRECQDCRSRYQHIKGQAQLLDHCQPPRKAAIQSRPWWGQPPKGLANSIGSD